MSQRCYLFFVVRFPSTPHLNLSLIRPGLFRPKAHIAPCSVRSRLTQSSHSTSSLVVTFSLPILTRQWHTATPAVNIVRQGRLLRLAGKKNKTVNARVPIVAGIVSKFLIPFNFVYCHFSLIRVAEPLSFSSPSVCCRNNLFLHQDSWRLLSAQLQSSDDVLSGGSPCGSYITIHLGDSVVYHCLWMMQCSIAMRCMFWGFPRSSRTCSALVNAPHVL